MELHDERPRTPKLPFIIGDLVLLAVAVFLVVTAADIPSTASIIGIVCCAGLGVVLLIAPFIADYTRNQDLKLDQRQHALEAMSRSTSAAVDQASIAANGLNEISETTKQNLRLIDELPDKIRAAQDAAEKKQTSKSVGESAQLRAEIEKLRELIETQAAASSKAMVAIQKELKEARKELKKIADTPPPAAPPTLETITEPNPEPKSPKPKKKSRAKKTPPNPPAESSLFADMESEVGEANPASEEAESAPLESTPITEAVAWDEVAPSTEIVGETKPVIVSKLSEGPSDISEDEAASATPDLEVAPAEASTESEVNLETKPEPFDPPPPAKDPEPTATEKQPEEDESPELLDAPAPEDPAMSSDGMTRLTVTAYIGIGNRLFIRGDGPGLSSEEGTPLQFVSIGKWRWETDAATGPIKATLWKNDEEICTSLGDIEINPGAQMETSANF